MSNARKPKSLEAENAPLNRRLAEQMLVNTIIKDLLGKR